MTLFSRVSHIHNNRSVSILMIMSLNAGQIPYKLSHASDAEDLLNKHNFLQESEDEFLKMKDLIQLFSFWTYHQCLKLK